jgi:hypothetical protein
MMAQGATKSLHLRHQETWSVPTSCTTKCPSAGTGPTKLPCRATRTPSGSTGQAKQSCRTTKYHFAGTERIFDFTPASQSRHGHFANSIPCDFACFRRIIGHDKHFPPRFHGFSQDFLTRGTVIPAKSGQNVVFLSWR